MGKRLLGRRFQKITALAGRPRLWPCVQFKVLPALEHGVALGRYQFDLVVDVGANKGQFAAFAADQWPKAQLMCFEPLPGPRTVLAKVLNTVAPGRHEIHACAVGETEDELSMHVASRDDSSSLLPLSDIQKQHYDMSEVAEIKVPVTPLIPFIEGKDLSRALLKIDVQGFEYQVLMGCLDRLSAFAAIYVEMSYQELYKGQRLAEELIAILGSKNIIQLGKYNLDYFNNKLIQADFLFTSKYNNT